MRAGAVKHTRPWGPGAVRKNTTGARRLLHSLGETGAPYLAIKFLWKVPKRSMTCSNWSSGGRMVVRR